MKKPNRYKPGRLIKTLGALEKYLKNNDYIFFGHQKKLMHVAFFESMQFRFVMLKVQGKTIRKAIDTQGDNMQKPDLFERIEREEKEREIQEAWDRKGDDDLDRFVEEQLTNEEE